MSLAEDKQAAREAATACRAAAHAAVGAVAPARLAAHFLATFAPEPGAAVSGYWPGRSELDIRPLMEALHARGHPIGLPVVLGRGKPLLFRRWQPGDALEPKKFGLLEPYASAPELTPRVLLVPFLAFDREGYRVGYGAGYYDWTLAGLRSRAKVLAVGVGYAAQAAERLPHHDHDERLDAVVTEEGVLRFEHATTSEGA
jgi:5-formyltetrahydrofolate cyclo-ligase